MRTLSIICTLFFLTNISLGQSQEEILAEGYLLYTSEKASWNGTDIFLAKFPDKKSDIGGYLSYTEDSVHSCIFYDQNDEPNILAKISFNKDFNLNEVKIDSTSRKLNLTEMTLFNIRKIALRQIATDTLFKQYKNTNLNPIPIIINNERKVFVLTGPKVNGVVILGNDYLITFNKNNKIKKKMALHQDIIPLEFRKDEDKVKTTMHTHLGSTSTIITSTDICTLLLYGEYTGWKQHIVISEKNVSTWDLERGELLVLTRKAWERIMKN